MRIARFLPPGARLVTLEMNHHYAQVAKQILGHAGVDAQLSPSPSSVPQSCTQGEEPVGGATHSSQRRWRLQEALIYTTLHCLQLPLQLFSRTPQNPLAASTPKPPEETAGRQQTKRSSTCKVDLLVGTSSALIPQLKKKFDLDKFDLVFIDHWKTSYLPDTKLLEECGLLASGTVLLADNVTCPGAPDYLQYVRNSPRYKSLYFPSQLEYLQVEDGMEKSIFLG
ncbi:catechol O-methyltransferase B isoform X3 [Xenopus laevis]|nr:catechol O-methyltransferase B isoform X3 [Xenopus laevis]